jgi:hypothetical protein
VKVIGGAPSFAAAVFVGWVYSPTVCWMSYAMGEYTNHTIRHGVNKRPTHPRPLDRRGMRRGRQVAVIR